jgi:hypothetical protein
MSDPTGRQNVSPRTHELKTWPEFFSAMLRGDKPFDVRQDDRGFAVGDSLWFREWCSFADHPDGGVYTGRAADASVTYVLRGGQFGIAEGYVVLGIVSPPAARPALAPPLPGGTFAMGDHVQTIDGHQGVIAPDKPGPFERERATTLCVIYDEGDNAAWYAPDELVLLNRVRAGDVWTAYCPNCGAPIVKYIAGPERSGGQMSPNIGIRPLAGMTVWCENSHENHPDAVERHVDGYTRYHYPLVIELLERPS